MNNNQATLCNWDTSFTVSPNDVQCVLTFCTNATKEPLEQGVDYAWAQRKRAVVTAYTFQVSYFYSF